MSYIGNSPSSVAFLTDYFSGNNSTTAFTMSVAPNTPTAVLVSISGVLQDPTAYSVSGTTLTFSSAPPSGSSNIVARYLGVPASGVTTTAYRTVTEYTATAGQTTFSPPSYTVGYLNVYRNGVRLGSADYTASNGTSVVLANACVVGDFVALESFYVSSVVNALSNAGGTINAVAGASPLTVQSNGNPAFLVGSASVGNIGVGTSSFAGSGIYSALQLGTTGSLSSRDIVTILGSNQVNTNFMTSGNYAPAYALNNSSGQHQWYITNTGSAGTAVSNTQIMTLDASGYLMLNTQTADARFSIHTDGTNTAKGYGIALVNDAGGGNTWTIQCGDYAVNNGRFTIYDKTNNKVAFKIDASSNYVTAPGIYSATSGSGANVYVDSSGILWRSTSSLKYKTDVETATHGLTDLLKLRPVTYKGTNDGDKIFGGLIAEEVHEAGLTEFVEYADDGTPDALAYGNMISLAVKSIQELKAIIDTQAEQIAALQAKVGE